jgi:hypothetical protein
MADLYDHWDTKRAGGPGPTAEGTPWTSSATLGPGDTTPYGQRALDSELATLALAVDGTRNATLNEISFSLYQLVFAGHLDEGGMREQVSAVARRIGLTTHEIIKTMGSARSAAQVKPRRELPEPKGTGMDVIWDLPVERAIEGAPVTLDGPDMALDEEPAQNPYDAFYIPRSALADLPRGEPLIEDVIDRHALFLIVGRDQSFKSFIALDWLLCLATGRPWLGKAVVQSRVLYVVGEGAYGLEDRVKAWELAYPREKVTDEWFTVRRAPVNLFHQKPDYLDLLERIGRERWDVIIFDTLQRMSSGAEQNSAKDAGTIVEALDRLRRRSGGSVGVVAHSGKSDLDVRGSSAFEDDADIVWRVRREPGEPRVELALDKRKDGPAEASHELFVRPIPGTKSIILQVGDPSIESVETKLFKHSVPLLRALTSVAADTRGRTRSDLMRATGLNSVAGFDRSMEALIRAGAVDKSETGRWPTYRVLALGVEMLQQVDGGM